MNFNLKVLWFSLIIIGCLGYIVGFMIILTNQADDTFYSGVTEQPWIKAMAVRGQPIAAWYAPVDTLNPGPRVLDSLRVQLTNGSMLTISFVGP